MVVVLAVIGGCKDDETFWVYEFETGLPKEFSRIPTDLGSIRFWGTADKSITIGNTQYMGEKAKFPDLESFADWLNKKVGLDCPEFIKSASGHYIAIDDRDGAPLLGIGGSVSSVNGESWIILLYGITLSEDYSAESETLLRRAEAAIFSGHFVSRRLMK